MTIASVFLILPKDTKPSLPGRNEVDFAISSEAGRLSLLPTWIGGERLRVRTGVPWIWEGRIVLPDQSRGNLVTITCSVRVEGTLETEVAKLRAFVTRLLKDRFEYDRLFGRALENAVTGFGPTIGNAFISRLMAGDSIEKGLLDELKRDHLYITGITITPLVNDVEKTRYFADDAGLTFKAADTIEENKVAFKAALGWGKDIGQIIGRLAYGGGIAGKAVAGPARPALVPGQVEPLEAWFRILLMQELDTIALQDLNDIGRHQEIVAKIKGNVSRQLGLGTGRVLDSLVLHLLPGGSTRDMRALHFTEPYEVPGTGGSTLQVMHSVKFAQTDRDRADAGGKIDPEALLKREIAEATRLFLLDKKFDEIVSLYFQHVNKRTDATASPSALDREVSLRVASVGMRHGLTIESTSAILKIPQQDFVDGHEIHVGMLTCPLAEPFLEPALWLTVKVQLAGQERQQTFASALGRSASLETSVAEAVRQTTCATLRGITALEYYGSSYVNGLPVLAARGEFYTADSLVIKLHAALDTMLGERFGLALNRVDLTPDRGDAIIDRMQSLNHNAIQYPSEGATQHIGLHDANNTILQIDATAKIIVSSLHPHWWSRFQSNTGRYKQLHEHIDAIRHVLTECLQSMHNELVGQMTGAGGDVLKRRGSNAALRFTHQMMEQHGLWAYVSPLVLTAARTSSNRVSTEIMIRNLQEELAALMQRRRDAADAFEREAITKDIEKVRGDLDNEMEKLERLQSALSVTRIWQVPETGEVADEERLPELSPPIMLIAGPTSVKRVTAVAAESPPQKSARTEIDE